MNLSPTVFASVQLKWTVEPSSLQVPVGKPVQLPCVAEGSPSPKIEWRKLDDPAGDGYLGSNLRFLSIEQKDAGNYECRATNGVDEGLSARIRVDVLGK